MEPKFYGYQVFIQFDGLNSMDFFGLDLSSSLESNNNYSAGNTPVGVDGYAGERHNGAQGTQDDSSAGGWSDEASDPALPG